MEKLLLVIPSATLSSIVGLSFENTLQTGQIILGVLLTIGTIAGVIYGVKWRTAAEVQTNVAQAARDLFEMKDSESKVLQEQLLETKDLIAKQAQTIARLEQLPNLERILQHMGEMSVIQDAAAERRVELALAKIERHWLDHNEAAEERAQRIIKAIKEERSR